MESILAVDGPTDVILPGKFRCAYTVVLAKARSGASEHSAQSANEIVIGAAALQKVSHSCLSVARLPHNGFHAAAIYSPPPPLNRDCPCSGLASNRHKNTHRDPHD